MRVRITLAAAVAASLTLGACASAGGGAGLSSSYSADAAGGSGAGTVAARESGSSRAPVIRVDNRNWADVVVYAVRSGRKQRLGMVTSMSMARFRLPDSMVTGTGELQLLVDPIGSSNRYLSAPVLVGPGQDVAFNVQNYLPMSSISVWEPR
jgi:hypothetical protein